MAEVTAKAAAARLWGFGQSLCMRIWNTENLRRREYLYLLVVLNRRDPCSQYLRILAWKTPMSRYSCWGRKPQVLGLCLGVQMAQKKDAVDVF